MSEVDQVLPWTGLKPSPLDEEELRIGVHPWLRTESLTDQRSLSERALRWGHGPSLFPLKGTAFTNCFTSLDSACFAPRSPALTSCCPWSFFDPSLLRFLWPDLRSLKGPCLEEKKGHFHFTIAKIWNFTHLFEESSNVREAFKTPFLLGMVQIDPPSPSPSPASKLGNFFTLKNVSKPKNVKINFARGPPQFGQCPEELLFFSGRLPLPDFFLRKSWFYIIPFSSMWPL